jgi:putative AbiEii toxin of type IV toxin-antitoxin system
MPQHYSEIDFSKIPDAAKSYRVVESEGEPHMQLRGLDAINLFVGPNNSGKSRFLRELCKTTKFSYKTPLIKIDEIKSQVVQFCDIMSVHFNGQDPAYGPIQGPNDFLKFVQEEWLEEGENVLGELIALLTSFITTESFQSRSGRGARFPQNQIQSIHKNVLVEPARNLLSYVSGLSNRVGGEDRIYISALRGLRTFQGADPYKQRTVQDYKFNADVVFTGQELYVKLREMLLGSREKRDMVRAYENFLGKEFFGCTVSLTPHIGGDVIHVLLGEEERPIYELGDGIQSLIIITFLAYTASKRSLFFIEEPDTHMHAGMQRKFLELFLRHEKLRKHQVFVTTHSNHFLDMAADYSGCTTLLFRNGQLPDGKVSISLVRPAERLVLEELGVRASSVFLTNATIWVEGPTDRLYLREYLRRYLMLTKLSDNFREDTHYSFAETGGACISNFHFDTDIDVDIEDLKRGIKVASICSNSFVVLDGDNRAKARGRKISEVLKKNLFILEGKEVENILPVEALRAYVKKRLRINDAESLQLEDYHKKQEPLGSILDTKFKTNKFSKDKTIKNKSGLCEFCIDFMRTDTNTWELTPEARQLCAAVVRFVSRANDIRVDLPPEDEPDGSQDQTEGIATFPEPPLEAAAPTPP